MNNPVYIYIYIYELEHDSFYQQTGIKYKEETSEVLHLECSLWGAEKWIPR